MLFQHTPSWTSRLSLRIWRILCARYLKHFENGIRKSTKNRQSETPSMDLRCTSLCPRMSQDRPRVPQAAKVKLPSIPNDRCVQQTCQGDLVATTSKTFNPYYNIIIIYYHYYYNNNKYKNKTMMSNGRARRPRA